jgi:hypothetical protein
MGQRVLRDCAPFGRAARGTIRQITTPDNFRGRVMGVFQLSNRGLHPLGQVQSGLLIPLTGAPAATFQAIPKFRGDDQRYKIPPE